MINVITIHIPECIDTQVKFGYTRRWLDTPNYSSSNHFIKKRRGPLITTGKRALFCLKFLNKIK